MIKCGKLKGKDGEVADQCILYSKDGKKALYYFPYSKYGGKKRAKAAARDRKKQLKFFKRRFRGQLDVLEASLGVSFNDLF